MKRIKSILIPAIIAWAMVSVFASAGLSINNNRSFMHERAPLLIVEVCIAEIDDFNECGDFCGTDQNQEYISYPDGAINGALGWGDRALTFLVYNPFSNSIDDICWRIDFKI